MTKIRVGIIVKSDFPDPAHVSELLTLPELVVKLSEIPEASLDLITVAVTGDTLDPKAFALVQSKDIDIVIALTRHRELLPVLLTASIPVIVAPRTPTLMGYVVDMVASLRIQGKDVFLANSVNMIIDRIKAVIQKPYIGGRRVLLFSNSPFDSKTMPCPNLDSDQVRRVTGVEVLYHPLDELKKAFDHVNETRAQQEMEKWISDAVRIVEPSKEDILSACRLYIALQDIVRMERLSGISIDCCSPRFRKDLSLPHPCLAFSRLRDDGISAPCEADLWALLSSLLLEQISKRPSFMGNVSAVDVVASTTTLAHCVVPLKLHGFNAQSVRYSLRDYHGSRQGVAPEIDFPTGEEVTMGCFTKDIRGFTLWPGTVVRAGHIECRNSADIRIPDPCGFLQSIAGCHHVMVFGNYMTEIAKALRLMNIHINCPLNVNP